MTQIPIMLGFTFCYWVTELGVFGQLQNPLLREKIYPVLSRASNVFTDFKFVLRGPQPPKNKIVVVEVDGEAIDSFGRWPWHRDMTAFLIEKAFQEGAKVVGLDMTFSEPDPRVPAELMDVLKKRNLDTVAQKFETDSVLQKVIYNYSDRLVLGWASDVSCQPLYDGEEFCPVLKPEALSQFPEDYDKFSFDFFHTVGSFNPAKTPMISFVTPLANIPMYNGVAKHAGYFNSSLDADGYIRRINLMAIAKGRPFPSLPLEMVRTGLGEKLQLTLDERQHVKSLGYKNSGKTIEVTPLGVMQINFRGPSSVFTHISATDLMRDKEVLGDTGDRRTAGQKKSDILKDAYVLVGVTALGVFDMRQFPFEANAPGVYGHANILDNLLSSDPLISGANKSGAFWVIFFMLVGVAFFAFLIERFDAIPALSVFLVTFFGLGFVDIKLLFARNYNLNTVFIYLEVGTVFVLILAAKYVLEERNKKFIRSAFSKYVAPMVVDSILKDPTKLSLGGEKREMTVLFSDIRSFTTFSEKMDAKALASFLNDYLGIMTGLVFTNEGTLDKYIGDAVMAFWGAPLNQPNHAYNSCKASILMLQALEKNYERFKSQYGIDVQIGIGINSGVVNVGNMGSEQTFEYTVIGDHVNLASRVEGLTKKYGVTILTTRFTFECIQSSGQPLPPHRVLDDVKVKGKKKAVELIQVLDKEYPSEGLKLFAEGRELYKNAKWTQAHEKFESSQRLISAAIGKTDGPSAVFMERCKEFEQDPPSSWDGSWEMDSK